MLIWRGSVRHLDALSSPRHRQCLNGGDHRLHPADDEQRGRRTEHAGRATDGRTRSEGMRTWCNHFVKNPGMHGARLPNRPSLGG
jgi:hypothetical protein